MRSLSAKLASISLLQSLGQLVEALDVRQAPGRGQPHALALLAHLLGGDLALLVGAADHQPGGQLQQARGEAHALGCIEHRGRPAQRPGLLAAGPVEIDGSALHQGHALAEDRVELIGGGEVLAEGDGDAGCGGTFTIAC